MNQQDKDKQTLRPSPDFKVGEKVIFEGNIGVVVSVLLRSQFPIQVIFREGLITFTRDGRYSVHGEVVLQRLEEGEASNILTT